MYSMDNNNVVNESKFIEEGKGGTVDKIKTIRSGDATIYRITISAYNNIMEGDKLASRYSQKGIIGKFIPYKDMPYITSGSNKGLRPELIFSPLSLTSRSTPGFLIECHLGNYAVREGKCVDATSFRMTPEILKEYGIQSQDSMDIESQNSIDVETFYDPVINSEVKMTLGICYIRILKHIAETKQKSAGYINHHMDKMLRQVSKGGPHGGVMNGIMELFAYCAHSAPHLINAFYCQLSDGLIAYFCRRCGALCDDFSSNNFRCKACNSLKVVPVETAYALIIAIRQLASAGVQLSLFPELIK